MSWKRNLVENLVRAVSLVSPSSPLPVSPKRILVLRNNDIGDLLVISALFEALKRKFPEAKIIAAVGSWACPVIENNPFVDEVFRVTAPWHNKAISGQTDGKRFAYCFSSPEVAELRARKCDVGIDVLGSPFGSFMMMRAGIPYRLGVRGYAGGWSGCHKWVESDGETYVGRGALKFVELLGASEAELPSVKPQLYLSAAEVARGEELWGDTTGKLRLVMGVGGGFPEKCWPPERFRELLELLEEDGGFVVKLVGGKVEVPMGESLAKGLSGVETLCGKVSLRETFALTAAADRVVTNPSMLMHVAAAFSVPAVVSMGPFFPSVIEHNRLWICNDITTVLGCEVKANRHEVATAREVFDALKALQKHSTPPAVHV
ncbi:MAG TPA: glycosyltransferase family 9 protein [Chthoniobacterales bacterium]|jgi:heptosyltransferase-2